MFLTLHSQNQFGRFIKLIELITGKGKGVIAIPIESIGNGWDDFGKKVRVFTNSTHSGFFSENRVSFHKAVDSQTSNRKEVGSSLHHDLPAASYISALNAPVQNNSMNQKVLGDVSDIWYSQKMKKLGEVEGSLWRAWAEISA